MAFFCFLDVLSQLHRCGLCGVLLAESQKFGHQGKGAMWTLKKRVHTSLAIIWESRRGLAFRQEETEEKKLGVGKFL